MLLAPVEIEKTVITPGVSFSLCVVFFFLQRESAKTGHKVNVMITSFKNPGFNLTLLNTVETPDNLSCNNQ